MLFASMALAVLALALAWPVPILLAKAAWPARSPGTALALWQAIALAGGLSMIGSLVVFGLSPYGTSVVDGARALIAHVLSGNLPPGSTIWSMFALCFAFLLTAHLLLNLALTAIRTERQRRRHHSLVQLLSAPMPDRPDTRLLEHPAPVAYCLPGASRSVTVLSDGLLRLLDARQLRAVIAHERAHLEQLHHLVLLAFKSWHSALPWFPIANRAENAVALLVEMLADDRARRDVDDETLATAVALVATGDSGQSAPPQAEPSTVASSPQMVGPRVSRLVEPTKQLPFAARAAVGVSAAALLIVPPVLLVIS